MISIALVLGLILILYFIGHIVLIHRYYKTRYKPNLYFAVTAFFLSLTALFGILMATAFSVNNLSLAMLFYRSSITLGILGFVFLNVFAFSMTKTDENMRGVWIPFISFFIMTFIFWAFNPVAEGVVGGTTKFALTSTYKAPYGLPLVETILVLMTVMAAYPTYLFFRVAKDTKYRFIKIKSLLICLGIIILATAYAIEMTDAVSYQYMPIYRLMILIGASIIFFTYMMPRQTEVIPIGRAPASADSLDSFVERFLIYPSAPTVQTQSHAFSKTLELEHKQMAGRKVIFEFDPSSRYEKAIQDFADEASANFEPTVIFTRRGSAIHSVLRDQKAVKFFCLTQQVSVPKEFSENELLLPAKDTSLMLDVFDKTLKAHPEVNINMVFDSLSDLVVSIGFEKTYRFVRYAIEMLTLRNTVMFLLNQTAHDPKITSSLRSLFSDQISFGRRGIQTVKLSEVEVGKVETYK